VWLIGNWTITLSGMIEYTRCEQPTLTYIVNFGFASLLSGTIAMYHPDFALNDWQLLLVFYAICLLTLVICTFFNKYLPMVDTICAAWTALAILIICIALSVKADVGRHSASYTLGHYGKLIDTCTAPCYAHHALDSRLIMLCCRYFAGRMGRLYVLYRLAAVCLHIQRSGYDLQYG
jgi:hypothetical protein